MKDSPHFLAILGMMISWTPLLIAAQQSNDWIDPSPHSEMRVPVEEGVQLEVLDWGGSGRPILLLAGLPDTAHIFDEFAPTLTPRYRVYAVTRRGFGKSSAPDSGYDIDRLAEDVMEVVHSLGLNKPIIVGHSFAGEEMHILGDRYASEIAALVYIEAAFNRADQWEEYDAKLREMPRVPRPQAGDLRSMSALRDFLTRNNMPSYPEAEVRRRHVVAPAGNITGPRQPAPAALKGYSEAMRKIFQEYRPKPIRVPALAIYAVPNRPEDLMRPWHDRNALSIQQTIQELYVLARERYRRQAEWFQSFARDSSRVIGMSGDHYLFVLDPSKVKEEVEAFASSFEG